MDGRPAPEMSLDNNFKNNGNYLNNNNVNNEYYCVNNNNCEEYNCMLEMIMSSRYHISMQTTILK